MTEVMLANQLIQVETERNLVLSVKINEAQTTEFFPLDSKEYHSVMTIDDLVTLSTFCEGRIKKAQIANKSLQDFEHASLPFKIKQKEYWLKICQAVLNDETQVIDAKVKLVDRYQHLEELKSILTATSATSSQLEIKFPTTLSEFTVLYTSKLIDTSLINQAVTKIINTNKSTPFINNVLCSLVKLVKKENYFTQLDFREHLIARLAEEFTEGKNKSIQEELKFSALRTVSNWLRSYLKHKQDDKALSVLKLLQFFNLSYNDMKDLSILSLLNKLENHPSEIGHTTQLILQNAKFNEQKKGKLMTDAEESVPIQSDSNIVNPTSTTPQILTLRVSAETKGQQPIVKTVKKSQQLAPNVITTNLKSILRIGGGCGKSKKTVSFSNKNDIRFIPAEMEPLKSVETPEKPDIFIPINHESDIYAPECEQFSNWRQPLIIDFSNTIDFCPDDIAKCRGGTVDILSVRPSKPHHAAQVETPSLKFDMAAVIDGVETVAMEEDASDNELLSTLNETKLLDFKKRKHEVEDVPDKRPKFKQ